MTEITGYTMEDINRLGWYQTMYPDADYQHEVQQRMERMRRGDDLRGEEWRVVRADGEERVLSISTSRLETEDGKTHVLALMLDVTERRRAANLMELHASSLQEAVEKRTHELARANDALRREMEEREQAQDDLRFKTLLLEAQSETSIDGILVVDGEGGAISFNQRFKSMWSIPQELLETGDDDAMLEFVTDMLQSPEAFFAKVRHLYTHPKETSRDEIGLKDGRWFDRYSAPLVDPDRRYRGRIWFFRDVTERKNAETEREGLLQEIREALSRIKTLKDLIPICASCKKIRDDEGFWHQVEAYVRDRTEANFSHGLCPECYDGLIREADRIERQDEGMDIEYRI